MAAKLNGMQEWDHQACVDTVLRASGVRGMRGLARQLAGQRRPAINQASKKSYRVVATAPRFSMGTKARSCSPV